MTTRQEVIDYLKIEEEAIRMVLRAFGEREGPQRSENADAWEKYWGEYDALANDANWIRHVIDYLEDKGGAG